MNTRRGFLAGAAVAPLLAAMGPCAQAGESETRFPAAQPFALSSGQMERVWNGDQVDSGLSLMAEPIMLKVKMARTR